MLKLISLARFVKASLSHHLEYYLIFVLYFFLKDVLAKHSSDTPVDTERVAEKKYSCHLMRKVHSGLTPNKQIVTYKVIAISSSPSQEDYNAAQFKGSNTTELSMTLLIKSADSRYHKRGIEVFRFIVNDYRTMNWSLLKKRRTTNQFIKEIPITISVLLAPEATKALS